jgi:hypothetical protein
MIFNDSTFLYKSYCGFLVVLFKSKTKIIKRISIGDFMSNHFDV